MTEPTADPNWLIYSFKRNAWYRSNCQGYAFLDAAGRYTEQEAKGYANNHDYLEAVGHGSPRFLELVQLHPRDITHLNSLKILDKAAASAGIPHPLEEGIRAIADRLTEEGEVELLACLFSLSIQARDLRNKAKALNAAGLSTADGWPLVDSGAKGRYYFLVLDKEDARTLNVEIHEMREIEGGPTHKAGDIIRARMEWEEGRSYSFEIMPDLWSDFGDDLFDDEENWHWGQCLYKDRSAAEAASEENPTLDRDPSKS